VHGRANSGTAAADESLHAGLGLNEEPERLRGYDDDVNLVAGLQEGSGHVAHPLSKLRVGLQWCTRSPVPSAVGQCGLRALPDLTQERWYRPGQSINSGIYRQ